MPRIWLFIGSILLLSTLYSLGTLAATSGTDTCEDSGLDWYRSYAGETPCRTYERLRQICNPNFQVTTLSTQLPPDVCKEEPDKSECCCNTVAFGLSMLCLSCQQGVGKDGNGPGRDARPGTYEQYLSGEVAGGPFCPTVHNRTLPALIQTSVCQQGIKIFDLIFTTTWLNDGAWFFGYVRDRIVNATRNATEQSRDPSQELFKICPEGSATTSLSSRTNSASTPTTTGNQSSNSDSSTNDGKGMAAGAIAGIAIAIAIVIAAIIAAVTFYRIHKSKHRATKPPKTTDVEPYTFQALPSGPPEPHFTTKNVLQPNRYRAAAGNAPFVSTRPQKSVLPPRIENDSPTEPSSFSTSLASGTSGNQSVVTSSGYHGRHTDGGPVSHPDYLNRTISGRLPPAYGDLPERR